MFGFRLFLPGKGEIEFSLGHHVLPVRSEDVTGKASCLCDFSLLEVVTTRLFGHDTNARADVGVRKRSVLFVTKVK